jgi:hypothetical protein
MWFVLAASYGSTEEYMDIVKTSGDEVQIERSSNGQVMEVDIHCEYVTISFF